MVVAQFVEQSPSDTRVHGSNPVIGKFYSHPTLLKVRPGETQFKKSIKTPKLSSSEVTKYKVTKYNLWILTVKKWANPGLFFVFFSLFKQTSNNFLQQINMKNVNSIQNTCQDSNPRPLDHESSPITTNGLNGILCLNTECPPID